MEVSTTGHILDEINNPADLRQLATVQLPEVCAELRQYIIDVLKAIDAENFIFSFNQPLTTASITQRDNKNFVYVVTPVRTKTM